MKKKTLLRTFQKNPNDILLIWLSCLLLIKKKSKAVGVTFKIIGENTKNNFLKEEVSQNHCFFPLLVRTKI